MSCARAIAQTEITMPRNIISRTIAPEDIRAGMYVAVSLVEIEAVSPRMFMGGCGPGEMPDPKLMRWTQRPCEPSRPLRVEAVSLPYVHATDPVEGPRTLDVRQHRLVRLTKNYATKAFESYQSQAGQPNGEDTACPEEHANTLT